MAEKRDRSWLARLVRLCLDNRLVVLLIFAALLVWGVVVAPFDWNTPGIPRDPVPVDAIPDIGENQQIVFTNWTGRSPQDVEDQVTYPLTTALLGVPQVKTVRSFSMFGFSTIYVIFKENVDFYWARSRILEKLNSLPAGTLPEGVQPSLGPDATALGQVFWYTLEGRDERGNITGGWDLDELRSIQDWYVRYALQSAEGVAEAASVGGHVKEYQVDVDPAALRQHNVTLGEVFQAVRSSNVDVGARTVEINRVEYVVRGIGFFKTLEDIEYTAVKTVNHVPVYIRDVAHVTLGPGLRRGVLDKEGAEAVGGVVVVRYGENPLSTIANIKEKIREIAPGLPAKTLDDGRISRVTIVPFYDRTGLIKETLNTLNRALVNEILITVIVILVMIMHLNTSFIISGILPATVLMVFIAMKGFGVDANIVALSGIAIAIGTVVDMGIVVSENILRHLEEAGRKTGARDAVVKGVSEVGGAVLTAVATTVVSFIPVFAMQAAEGKLFKPLAYTKTFALVASMVLALTLLPVLAHLVHPGRKREGLWRRSSPALVVILGIGLMLRAAWWAGILVLVIGLLRLINLNLSGRIGSYLRKAPHALLILLVSLILASVWAPLGAGRSFVLNVLFVFFILVLVLGGLRNFIRIYPRLMTWALNHKKAALAGPFGLVILGLVIWIGFGDVFGFMPDFIRKTGIYRSLNHTFPGLGREFMPPLDEGSYLFMPTTMPHAGMEEAQDVLRTLDMALYSVPEVETVVGKLGRADTPLDPAPISMVETVVIYKPEFKEDEKGNRLKFKTGSDGTLLRDEEGRLIPDRRGKPFRQWRSRIRTPDDIWDELVRAARIPGTTSAPRLQPISARIVMLQSGMRAPMGIKIKGPDLETIERVGLEMESLLKEVPAVEARAVVADRIVGKPYLVIDIDRRAIARYGISLRRVQDVIEVAIGGRRITTTVEGRERYPVRVRYMRELRDDWEALGRILVPAGNGAQIPLAQLADIRYVRGPQVIKSEDTFLVGYVLFDRKPGQAEVDVVDQARRHLENMREKGELNIPPGVSYSFAGSYENQVRASARMRLILPLALFVIFMILYFQFRRVSTTLIIFSGIFVAWAGGFVMIWLYGQSWFLNFRLFGQEMQTLFQIHPVNLSIAVWVGFLALFGIATDDGVLISTYLRQSFLKEKPRSTGAIRKAAVKAASRRIRPAMMTTATTLLALIPVLTSFGRGSDVMVPMAIPSFGGMAFAILTTFVVPVLYSALEERKLRKSQNTGKK
jgi:Cu(I)/Ag(I) efflux system membrane protein CusA/SilA